MKFYDAHIHFYFSFPPEDLKRIFSQLSSIGLMGFNALVFAEFPHDMRTVYKMVPRVFHNGISLRVLEMQKDPFPYFAWAKPLKIIPFVDSRFMVSGIEEKMERFKETGFQGLKLLYVPEADDFMQMEGMADAFGWSLRESEAITARLIDSASSLGMCVLLHADLRRYGDFVKEMIVSHRSTNFNIPHFGFSRKTIAHFLETCPNCYTDTSGLLHFMEEDPLSYRDFIQEYQDRIIFGSDAFVHEPEHIDACRKFVERLVDKPETVHKLICKNYEEFHGIQPTASTDSD